MNSLIRRNYRIILAGILGLMTLAINISIVKIGEAFPLPFGNIVLFLVASSFGPLGACITSAIAQVPLLILKSQDPAQCIRIIVLMTSLGALCKRFPVLQPTILLVPVWWLLAAITAPFSEFSTARYLTEFCFDILLFSLARTLFLSRTISAVMFDKLYRLPVKTFIPEILAIATGTFIGVLLFSSVSGALVIDAVIHRLGVWLIFVSSFSYLFGPLLGMMLTRTLLSEYGIDLKNLINVDSVKTGFVTGARGLLLGADNSLLENRSHNFTGETPATFGALDSHNVISRPIIALASDRTIVYCSESCIDFFKFHDTPATLVGRSMSMLGLPSEALQQIDQLLNASTTRSGIIKDEFRIPKLSEDPTTPVKSRYIEVQVEGSKRLESTDSSLTDGFVIKFKDITHQRTIEADSLRTQKSEILGQLSQGIAHSIADALTVIQGISFLGGNQLSNKESEATSTLQTRLQEIANVAANAGKTMQQLLEYADDNIASPTQSNVVELLENRLEFLKQSVGESFCIELQKTENVLAVEIEQNSVLQAITHLLLHARESYGVGVTSPSTGSGTMTIECDTEEISPELGFIQPGARPGKYARIRIKDTGAGMSAETLSKAFDPQSGNLKLSTVFSVMRDHDGFLTAESVVNKGTTISLYFPLRNNQQVKIAAEPSVTTPTSTPAIIFKTALIVEDDPAVRRVLELLLQQAGITCISFENGEGAVLYTGQVDFFISDLILPGINGIEVAKRLTETRGIPGLVATGSHLNQSELPSNVLLLPKPYGSEELLACIVKLTAATGVQQK